MWMDFNNLNDLLNHLEKQAVKALKNEGAITARKEMQRQIDEVVYSYDAAQPELRRKYNDGLIDPRNIEISPVGDDSISIENIAYDGDRNVPYIVESGEGYEYGASPELTKGRKFTEATVESLRNSNKLEQSLKNGLNRLGIDARL